MTNRIDKRSRYSMDLPTQSAIVFDAVLMGASFECDANKRPPKLDLAGLPVRVLSPSREASPR